MKDITQITDQELAILLSTDASFEDVKSVLANPEVYDQGYIREETFSSLYAEARRSYIEHAPGTDDWANQDVSNAIQGEMIARDINFWIRDPRLIFTTTIKPMINGTIEKFTFWVSPDRQEIVMVEKFSSGEVWVETDHDIELSIDTSNPSGININELGYDFNSSLYNETQITWMSDDLSIEQKEEIANGFAQKADQYMEENGWTNEKIELWFYGPLEIIKDKEYIDE